MSYIERLDSFDINSLPNLDMAVLGALELFQHTKLPTIDASVFKHPLVVGSGNAEATGRIIFETEDAVFASESNFEEKLDKVPSIDGVVLISASGEKHAPVIARQAHRYEKPVMLITNSPDSSTIDELNLEEGDSVYVFPKNREPYTYNTSTYMGMILGRTSEDAAAIDEFINTVVSQLDYSKVGDFDKFYLIVPPEFAGIIRMLEVKFIELFGRNIARDVETGEYVPHATTVAHSQELFISFGDENTTWGEPEKRLNVPLPDEADYGAMMAVGYFVIGQIQKAQPDYFKQNIEAYTAEVSQIFGNTIEPIVEK